MTALERQKLDVIVAMLVTLIQTCERQPPCTFPSTVPLNLPLPLPARRDPCPCTYTSTCPGAPIRQYAQT